MKSPEKLMVSVLLFVFLLFGSILPGHAEPGSAVQEVMAEATYLMNDSDTGAKAEAQVLLRAKKAALEQVSSASGTLENAANLPNDIFKVTVLDKKTYLNGDKFEYWVQIQVLLQLDKVEARLKELRGCEDFSYENVLYLKDGKDKYKSKVWRTKNASREDRAYFGMPLTIITRFDDHVMLALCNNKYYEEASQTQEVSAEDLPIDVEIKPLGNESVLGVTTQKRLCTQTYADGKVLKEIQWHDPATNWVIKRESSLSTEKKTVVRECRNVQVGPQSTSLFEIPVGYTKCATFAELFTDGNMNNVSSSNANDPLQKATDAALEAAAQRVLDNAIGGLFSF